MKYKVGDMVRTISNTDKAGWNVFPVGTVGRITAIEFDNNLHPYLLVESGGDCWWYSDDMLELVKDSDGDDQTIKADSGKLKLTLVPQEIIKCIAAVRMYGTEKYGGDPDNWKRVSKERYRDAAFRHWLAYLDDPDKPDEESGLPHLWHVATNIAFLCYLEKGEA